MTKHPRLVLALYALAVVAVTLVHQPLWLAGAFGVALLAAGRARWRLLRRAVAALLLFNLAVSLAYAVLAWWRGEAVLATLLLMNLRVALLVFLGFWLVSRIRLPAALAGWPTLSMLVTLAIGQIRVYARILEEFRLAFQSRNLDRPRAADVGRHVGAQGGALLDKSMANATEIAMAMRSRGTFDA